MSVGVSIPSPNVETADAVVLAILAVCNIVEVLDQAAPKSKVHLEIARKQSESVAE